MKLVWWHLAGRFYEARSIRAFSNHLRFGKKAEKYSSRIDQERARHVEDVAEFDRILPPGWWLLPSVIAGLGILSLGLWSAVAALIGAIGA